MNQSVKTAGHLGGGAYDLVAFGDYYLTVDQDGTHIQVVSPTGEEVAEICVHSLTPQIKLYDTSTSTKIDGETNE